MLNNQDLFERKVRYFTRKYAAPQIGYQEYNVWDFSYSE